MGASHPQTAASLNNLAELYRVQGRYTDAEPLYLRALLISSASLGMEHPQTQQVQMNQLVLLSHLYTNGDLEALFQLLAQGELDENRNGEESQE